LAALILAVLYAAVLFAFASWAERRGSAAIRRRLRFPAYALALAVYCTSWTFYGAVGSAVTDGWSYLPIYLGPILVFLLGARFLRRLVEGVKADGANSISEFIGGRFGNSQGVAALVTVLALMGTIPYIALQLRSLSTSFAMVSGGQSSPATMAFAALGLALFAMIYGTRRYDAASRTDAVLFAVGFESLLKLGALLVAAVLALLLLASAGPEVAARGYDRLAGNFAPSHIGMDFFVITALSMAAIVCLPRQFYIGVTEAQEPDDIVRARWPFIAYMLLTLAVVIPISAAGIALLTPESRPDQFVLELPLSQDMQAITLLVFLGGFSAATAMVLVETIALATMVSNGLVAPVLLRGDRLRGEGALGRALLLARRLVIAAIMLAALGWALGIGDNQRLASIGLVAFAAMAQFAPALILAVLGPNRDALAAKAGLATGLVVWAYTLALPQVLPADVLARLDMGLLAPLPLSRAVALESSTSCRSLRRMVVVMDGPPLRSSAALLPPPTAPIECIVGAAAGPTGCDSVPTPMLV
jgi:Na+/proline symporter